MAESHESFGTENLLDDDFRRKLQKIKRKSLFDARENACKISAIASIDVWKSQTYGCFEKAPVLRLLCPFS
jgi:hypothetical protein